MLAGALSVVVCAPLSPQSVPVGDPFEDYLRVLQLSGSVPLGSFTVRPLSARTIDGGLEGMAPWIERLKLEPSSRDRGPRISPFVGRLRNFVNSSHPVGQNDGVVWQGRGLTSAIDVRATGRWSSVTLTVNPTFLYTQNAEFDLAPVGVVGMPVYAYPWRKMDYPQRFGPDAVWTIDPGQSSLSLDFRGAVLAVGTNNLWWGPGIRNAIVLSNNAPGFAHGSLGTGAPVDTGIGAVEAQWIWGRLGQSQWFDPAATISKRFLTGIVLTYSPKWLEGLSLGGTRVFQQLVMDGGVSFGDYFLIFQRFSKESLVTPGSPVGDDEADQLLSLFARWVLPESGFEVYAEWARNDHSGNFTDFIQEPEHSQAYTLGFRKAVSGSVGRVVTLKGELTHLGRASTFQVRAIPTYYAHHIVTQGYTHEGQVIGAGIGPGGNAQFLGLDLFDGWGRAEAFVERRVHDNDAYYAWAEATGRASCCNDVSLSVGATGVLFAGDFDIGSGAMLTRELNRYFDGPNVWNLNVSLSASWRSR